MSNHIGTKEILYENTIDAQNIGSDDQFGGFCKPVLDALRQDFPFLADAIIDYSLGEVWSRQGLDDRTRQLATVAAFAAQGNLPQLLK